MTPVMMQCQAERGTVAAVRRPEPKKMGSGELRTGGCWRAGVATAASWAGAAAAFRATKLDRIGSLADLRPAVSAKCSVRPRSGVEVRNLALDGFARRHMQCTKGRAATYATNSTPLSLATLACGPPAEAAVFDVWPRFDIEGMLVVALRTTTERIELGRRSGAPQKLGQPRERPALGDRIRARVPTPPSSLVLLQQLGAPSHPTL